MSVEAVKVSRVELDDSGIPLDMLESKRVVSETEVNESTVLTPRGVLVPPDRLSVDILEIVLREVVLVAELSKESVEKLLLVESTLCPLEVESA